MTLPKGYGSSDPSKPPRKGSAKGKKIAIGIGAGAAVAILAVLSALYANNQPDRASQLVAANDNIANASNDLRADISILNDPITRGATQHLRVAVSNDDGLVTGAEVSGRVLYPDGIVESFNGTTKDGLYEHKWQIEGNSTPGVFRVNVVATSDGQRAETLTTFNVIES
jgi:hypothetical protein